jgi:hypothetical protein
MMEPAAVRRWMAERGEDDAGVVATAWAVTAPAVLAFLLVAVQGVLWWHAHHLATAAATEAVDTAQLLGNTAADGEAAARERLAESGHLTDVTVFVDRGDEHVTATVQGDAPRLIPGWDWGVTATAAGPTERFVPEAAR